MKVGIFNTAFVGDVALMGRLVDALHLAGHEIVLFSNPAGCALYEFDARVSRRVVVRKKPGWAKLKAMFLVSRLVAEERVDVLLLAHKSFQSGLIALLSRCTRVVTFAHASLSHRFFSKVETTADMHESERYLELARGLIDEISLNKARFSLRGDESLSRFSSAFPAFNPRVQKDFFICAPGSIWTTKRYPVRSHAELLCRLLVQLPNHTCVLSGGPSDVSVLDELLGIVDELQPGLARGGRILDARSCLPLPELIELMRCASFLICPDSAPLHIASATGTRSFVFFGPTPFDTGFGPLGQDVKILNYVNLKGVALPCQPCSPHGHPVCPVRHHKCLSDLRPDAVASVVLDSISR